MKKSTLKYTVPSVLASAGFKSIASCIGGSGADGTLLCARKYIYHKSGLAIECASAWVKLRKLNPMKLNDESIQITKQPTD